MFPPPVTLPRRRGLSRTSRTASDPDRPVHPGAHRAGGCERSTGHRCESDSLPRGHGRYPCATVRGCTCVLSGSHTVVRRTDASLASVVTSSTATTASAPFTRAPIPGRPSARWAGCFPIPHSPPQAKWPSLRHAVRVAAAGGFDAGRHPALGSPPPARTNRTGGWRCGSGAAKTLDAPAPTCPRAPSRTARAACGNRSSRWPRTARWSATTPMRRTPDTARTLPRRGATTGCTGEGHHNTVASGWSADRPGMPVVRKLPNGTYFMSYEICSPGGRVPMRGALPDLRRRLGLGDPASLGFRPETVDGKYFRAAPTIAGHRRRTASLRTDGCS